MRRLERTLIQVHHGLTHLRRNWSGAWKWKPQQRDRCDSCPSIYL